MRFFADQSTAGFGAADWLVVLGYMLLLVTVALLSARRSIRVRGGSDDFFLAGRSMPGWAVALSLLATMLSAATFIGGPEISYRGDLTYLSESIGGMIAIVIVAVVFIPRFYKLRVTSIYELVGASFGTSARRATSAMFLIGRTFASGARLFMVAIPFALIAFGNTQTTTLQVSIVIIAAVAAAYTMLGGIRAVIWTDALQAAILLVALLGAIWVGFQQIGLPVSDLLDTLRAPQGAGDGAGKLRVLNFSLDPAESFTVWAALTGWVLFHVAALGTDQDMAQRLLTCQSARRGAWAAILGKLLSVPMTALFLLLGLLLYVIYQRSDLLESAPLPPDETRDVFVVFILSEIPTGLRGLMIAGLFAAAMSSLDSALSAMGSVTVSDFRRRDSTQPPGNWMMRCIVLFWAAALATFACVCVHWQQHSGESLIVFALGVMMFAYSGMLAVFLTALLTRRGNAWSAIAALIVGFVCIAVMQPAVWHLLLGAAAENSWQAACQKAWTTPALPWKMTLATLLSFAVCLCGKRPSSVETGKS